MGAHVERRLRSIPLAESLGVVGRGKVAAGGGAKEAWLGLPREPLRICRKDHGRTSRGSGPCRRGTVPRPATGKSALLPAWAEGAGAARARASGVPFLGDEIAGKRKREGSGAVSRSPAGVAR